MEEGVGRGSFELKSITEGARVREDGRFSLAASRGSGFLVGVAGCIIPVVGWSGPFAVGGLSLTVLVADICRCSSPFWPPRCISVRFSLRFHGWGEGRRVNR